MSKRFYHIAYDLGVRPRAFIRELNNVGLSVGNQMVIIPDELEARIREMYQQLHAPAPEPVEAPVAEAPAAETEDTEVVEAGAPAEGVEVAEPEEAVAAEESAPAAEAPPAKPAAPDRRLHRAGTKPKPTDLVPTLDPRAGRLVKEAPRGGVPVPPQKVRGSGAGTRDGQRTGTGSPSDRAPGARRDGGRRAPASPYARKRGKETFHMSRRGRRGKSRPAVPKVRPTSIEVELPVTVKRFCELSTYKAAEIIKILFRNHKIMVTPNSTLDRDTVDILSIEIEIPVTYVERETKEDALLKSFRIEDKPEDLVSRPPVVTILGHVDHGKTTLLDKIRETDVAGREAGGITQHISSSMVTLDDGRQVTFIDTPGHEAFTEMRARGAQITDVVILIVAGDDGVMPQTAEAISHAKAAGVEIVVAITKCDKDSAQPERVKQQLAEHDVFVEGYGGDVSVFQVSGITGLGVKELLEHLALMAEVDAEKYRANPEALATGTVLESQSNPRRGILTTVLVQNGTLRKGDTILAGETFGTVRGLFNDRGQQIKEAGPSTPVEVIGLAASPDPGAKFYEAPKGADAKKIAETRRQAAREAELAAQSKPTSVESLLSTIDFKKVTEVNLVVKADVSGSLQPLKTQLQKLTNPEVRVRILHSGVGPINESDVGLASASDAFIIGFNVNADGKARQKAKKSGVNWKNYKVIYDIEQDVRDLMEGQLAPEVFEEVTGHAEILAIFTFSKIGNIAGCRVRDGKMVRDAGVRVFRGEELIHEGKMAALRREKDDAKEVKEGFECGITIKDFDAFDVGDTIEAFVIKTKKRTLADVKPAEPPSDEDAA